MRRAALHIGDNNKSYQPAPPGFLSCLALAQSARRREHRYQANLGDLPKLHAKLSICVPDRRSGGKRVGTRSEGNCKHHGNFLLAHTWCMTTKKLGTDRVSVAVDFCCKDRRARGSGARSHDYESTLCGRARKKQRETIFAPPKKTRWRRKVQELQTKRLPENATARPYA